MRRVVGACGPIGVNPFPDQTTADVLQLEDPEGHVYIAVDPIEVTFLAVDYKVYSSILCNHRSGCISSYKVQSSPFC